MVPDLGKPGHNIILLLVFPIKGQTKEIIDVMSVCFYADLSAKKKQELNIKYLND